MPKIFYIDPMSYGNLATYDYSLLSNIKDYDITFFGNIKYSDRQLHPRILFVPVFRYSDYTNKINKFFSYCLSIFLIVRQVIIAKPQIIHVQWFKMPIIDLLFCKLLESRGIKLIYTVHNILPHDSGEKYITTYKKFYQFADKLIVHTHKTKEELKSKLGISDSKIHIIPHGELCLKADQELVAKLKENLLNNSRFKGKVILSILGVQSKYKGCDMIAKLWSEETVFRENEDYLLLIMGKNHNVDYSPLKGLKNVHIEERFISNEEFLAALKITNILLMPYLHISQSGLLMTAINEKVPCLVSSVGALEEPLNIANVGWTIGQPEYQNLRNTLINILKDKNKILEKKLNSEAWEAVKKNYSWEKSSKLTCELYAQLL